MHNIILIDFNHKAVRIHVLVLQNIIVATIVYGKIASLTERGVRLM
jgi:hypothetical protein